MDMNASTAITEFVEFAIPRFSDTNKLFHVDLNSSLSYYSNDGKDDRNTYRSIHFLFQRPSNYTKVFVAVVGYEYTFPVSDGDDDAIRRRNWVKLDGAHSSADLNKLMWYMTSDHDSCWRSDGVQSVLQQIRNEMRTELFNDLRTVEHTPHEHVRFGIRPRFLKADVVPARAIDQFRGGRDTYMKIPINIEAW